MQIKQIEYWTGTRWLFYGLCYTDYEANRGYTRIVELEESKEMPTTQVKLVAKPAEVEAMQWSNNEPEMRDWVQNDKLLRFSDNKFEIFNTEVDDWIKVPMFHFVVKGVKGELYPISQEILRRRYTIVEK